MENDFLTKLEKENSSEIRSVNEFSFKSEKLIFAEIVEKEFASTTEEEQKAKLEEFLFNFYKYRGLKREEIKECLIALENNDLEKKREIFSNLAKIYEDGDSLFTAAENYSIGGDHEKAFEILVRAGHQGHQCGREFLFARDCLAAMGVDGMEANARMAEELKKMLEKDWPSFKIPYIYEYLGECLYNSGKSDEAIEAFMHSEEELLTTEEQDAYKLLVNRDYLESIGDFKEVVERQQDLIEDFGYGNRAEYIRLAGYYKILGKNKEASEALWKGKEYLAAAEIASELFKSKEPYLKAAKMYDRIRSQKQRFFSRKVWEYTEDKILKIYSEEVEKDLSIKSFKIHDPEKMLNRFNELFSFLYSAYSLPKPKESYILLSNKTDEYRNKADVLYQDFLRNKRLSKKSKIKEVFSDDTLVQSLRYSILGGINEHGLNERLKEAFKYILREVPDPRDSNEKVKELWKKSLEEERVTIGFNPVEMAALSYERGGDYSEAKKRYRKLKRFNDVKRMDRLIKRRKV
jgi:tetratricopeptide (TPR) repeat protein